MISIIAQPCVDVSDRAWMSAPSTASDEGERLYIHPEEVWTGGACEPRAPPLIFYEDDLPEAT